MLIKLRKGIWKGYVVSSGTLLTDDLFFSFNEVINAIIQDINENRFKLTGESSNGAGWSKIIQINSEMEHLIKLYNMVDTLNEELDADINWKETKIKDNMDMLINEDINDLFNDLAPENCYFGTHEGDASLFGFWINE